MEDSCGQRSAGRRCLHRAGHAGDHYDGGQSWPRAAPLARFNRKASRERCNAATGGLWSSDGANTGPAVRSWNGARAQLVAKCPPSRHDDATFIAHARADLPAALDMLDQIQGLANAWRALNRGTGEGAEALASAERQLRKLLDGAS